MCSRDERNESQETPIMSTILVVDDRPEDRELMSTLLGYAGHDVVEAASGDAALRLAGEYHPELIVTDILMPDMNGYEFVRRLREDSELGGTPVIFNTANYLEGEVRQLAEACRVSRFISKPSEPAVVLSTVAEALCASEPRPSAVASAPGFQREQLRVINNKLVEKVTELERVSAHRQQLLGLVLTAQEQERHRIADGIHDDSLQAVVAVGLWLENLRNQPLDQQTLAALGGLQETVALAAQRLRSLLFELRPYELQSHGLAQALRANLQYAQHHEGLAYTLDDQLTADPDPEARAFLYGVAQEALINVRKHAHASHVDVTLMVRAGCHVIRIHDDGIGFDVTEGLRARPGHLGLAALTERLEHAGGKLRVDTTPGAGTSLEFEVPVGIPHLVDAR
jgi:signal transduction histidine kinase